MQAIRTAATRLALAATLAIAGPLAAAIPGTYWNGVNASNASTLRATLNDTITAGHDNVTYSGAWAALNNVDEDPGNSSNVILIYTGQSRPKADQCHISACSDGDGLDGLWTREHIFPQSEFGSDEPMVSDLHALFSIDQDVNGWRSNSFYGEVTVTPTYNIGGSIGTTSLWEPRDQDKGNVARALFYMDVRYEGEGGEPNLSLINGTSNTSSTDGQLGDLDTLLQWHFADPPDADEIARNNAVYDEQFNANPFISHPEWVSILYGVAQTDGDTLNVAWSDVAPAGAQIGIDTAMLKLTVSASANEWDIDTLSLSELGTATDTDIESVDVWYDADSSGDVNGGDVLLSTGTFSAGMATLSLNSYRVNSTAVDLLVSVQPSATASLGDTIQVRANANGLVHAGTGGADVDPTYAQSDSGTATVEAAPGAGSIIISEIMYNPASDETSPVDVEWIELVNIGTTVAAFTDAQIQDVGDGISGTFDVTLQPGEIAILIPDFLAISDFKAAWGAGQNPIQVPSWANLNGLANNPSAGSENLEILDSSSNVLDAVSYDDTAPWPVDNGTSSIYVKNNLLTASDNDNGASWALSAIGTDGGYTNTTTAIFDGADVGSPGYVGAAPVAGSISSIAEEDNGGDFTVEFTDLNAGAPGGYTATVSSLSSGTAGSGVVTSLGGIQYAATFTVSGLPANFNGPVTFNLSIGDGTYTRIVSGLSFDVAAVNDDPMITAPPTASIPQGSSSSPLAITVGDIEDGAAALNLSVFSDNDTLLPPSGLVLGGSGSARTLTITPAPAMTGTADVTVTVEDIEGAVTQATISVTVTAATVETWRQYDY